MVDTHSDASRSAEPDLYEQDRLRLIERDLEGRGLDDPVVLAVMGAVRREFFVPIDLVEHAYEDRPLPIASGQTISQPYIVALMASAASIEPTDRVLEVGTGSGYGAAVLGLLAAEVWSIERHRSLARAALRRLRHEGYSNVHVAAGDGSLGWPDEAPFDAIVVTASGPEVPSALQNQLADGGRLILPLGPGGGAQSLLRITRRGDTFETDDLGLVRFVPLIGAQGWRAPGALVKSRPVSDSVVEGPQLGGD